jgi:hypothetical protein
LNAGGGGRTYFQVQLANPNMSGISWSIDAPDYARWYGPNSINEYLGTSIDNRGVIKFGYSGGPVNFSVTARSPTGQATSASFYIRIV